LHREDWVETNPLQFFWDRGEALREIGQHQFVSQQAAWFECEDCTS